MQLSIYFHAEGGPDLETSDPATVEALRKALGPGDHLVMAREFANQLRSVGRGMWADVLEGMEESHMVRVRFGTSTGRA